MDQLNEPLIALVNKDDLITGYAPKLWVHQKGVLHRAFSVFIFNSKGLLLLQRRADEKYHSAGLWTNTCCSHLNLGEGMETCIKNRLFEEMGIQTTLTHAFTFTYKISFDNDLTEHETDHVYAGIWNGNPKLNINEASDFKWVELSQLQIDLQNNPNYYTYWFKHIIESYFDELKNAFRNLVTPIV